MEIEDNSGTLPRTQVEETRDRVESGETRRKVSDLDPPQTPIPLWTPTPDVTTPCPKRPDPRTTCRPRGDNAPLPFGVRRSGPRPRLFRVPVVVLPEGQNSTEVGGVASHRSSEVPRGGWRLLRCKRLSLFYEKVKPECRVEEVCGHRRQHPHRRGHSQYQLDLPGHSVRPDLVPDEPRGLGFRRVSSLVGLKRSTGVRREEEGPRRVLGGRGGRGTSRGTSDEGVVSQTRWPVTLGGYGVIVGISNMTSRLNGQ